MNRSKNDLVRTMFSPDDVDRSLFPGGEGDLNEAEGIWSGGEEEQKKPLGKQVVEIVDAVLERATSSDRLQVHYSLKFVGGAFNGKEEAKFDGLATPKQASITQQQLKRLGIDTSKVSLKNLPSHLLTLKGKVVNVGCKQNGAFYNITFQGLVTEKLADKAAPSAGGGGRARGGRKF